MKGEHMEVKGKNTKDKRLLRQILAIAFLVFIGMTIYETLKQVIFPDITIWQSHIVTILFSTLCAAVVSFSFLREHIKISDRLADMNIESDLLRKGLENTIERFQESEKLFKILLKALPGGIFVHDLEGNNLLVNDMACHNSGYSKEELLNMSIMDIDPGLGPRESATPKWQDLGEGESINFETTHMRKDGSTFPVEVHLNVTQLDGESILLSIIFDITERKRIEEALNNAYNIINRSPAVAFLWRNAEGWPVEFVSGNVRGLFGYSAEEFTSGKIAYDVTVHPDDLERVTQEVTKNSEEGREHFTHKPYRIIAKDGETKWLDDMTFIRRDEKGDITHYEGIVLDISKRIRAEEEVRTLQGILPICSHCKKIRDDKGYWNQIENYIHEHSEAVFSHSICPECLKKYYPEYDAHNNGPKKE